MFGKLFAKASQPEAAEDRRAGRRMRAVDGVVEIDGAHYPLESWSHTGFLAGSYSGPRKGGEKLEIAVSVVCNGDPFNFACRAMTVRVDPATRKLVGAFVDLDARTRAEIARRFA